MIVIPLNEEARNGRRIPWVTMLLIGACLAVFLHTRGSDAEVDAKTEAKIEAAWKFYSLHPYIKVDPYTAELLDAARVSATAQEFRARHADSGSPPIPDFVIHHDQVEFEGIVDSLYETIERHSFYRFGFFPSTLQNPDVTLFGYVFAHEDWMHLVANLLLILLGGIFLEEVWGRGIFTFFLATSAAAAAAGYALLDPEGGALGGASGIAAALGGAFLARFAGTPIRFQYFFIPPFGGKFTAKGWVALPVYAAIYFAVDHVLTYGGPGIEPPGAEFSTWVHASGLAWGFGFAAILRVLRIEERFIRPSIQKKLVTQSNPALERALEARAAGRNEEALELLAGEVAGNRGNRDACLAYWDVASALGRPAEASDALLRVLRDEVGAGQKELAISHWRELTQRVPDVQVDTAVEGKIATFLIDTCELELAGFSLGRILDGACGEVTGDTAHRVARLAQDLDRDLALRAARVALDASDLAAAERDDVERLVAQLERPPETDAGPPAPTPETDPNEQTAGQLFDFHQADGSDLAAAGAEEGSPAAGAAPESGDELNAAPFELDDMTVSGSGTTGGSASEVFAHGEVDLPRDVDSDATDPAGPSADLLGGVAHGEVDLAEADADLPEIDAPDDDPLPEAEDLDPRSEAAPDDPPAMDPDEPAMDTFEGVDEPAMDPDEPAMDTSDGVDLSELPPLEPEPDPGRSLAEASFGPMPDVEPIPQPAADAAPPEASAEATAPGGDARIEPIPEEAPPLEPEALPLAEVGVPEPAPETAAPASEDERLGSRVIDLPDPDEASSGDAGPPRPQRPLKRMEAIPLSLGAEALVVDVGARGKATLGLERIDAVAVAGVRGLKPKPVVLIDLITNWLADDGQALKIVRVRSDRFDPRKLVDAENGSEALKQWIAKLLTSSEALALPDPRSASGSPFKMYDSLEDYERQVLRALI